MKKDQKLFPCWCEEFAAEPARNSVFSKGKDIVDAKNGWRVPASFVPFGGFEAKGVVLWLVPGKFDMFRGKPVVLPSSVILLSHALPDGKMFGTADTATGFPQFDPEKSASADLGLVRPDFNYVRGVVRSNAGKNVVFTCCEPEMKLWVVGNLDNEN